MLQHPPKGLHLLGVNCCAEGSTRLKVVTTITIFKRKPRP